MHVTWGTICNALATQTQQMTLTSIFWKMIGHVVLVMLAVMTLKQMAATMKVLAQIRVPMPVNKLATLQDAEAMLCVK